jgi:hypothetical protein
VEEPVPRRPVPLDEGSLDEEVPRLDRVHARIPDGAAYDERHSVERHPLGGDRTPLPRRPSRFGVRPLDEVLPGLFGPHRIDPRHVPRPQPSGLDELAGHDELRLLAKKAGARRDPEPRAPRPLVLALDLVASADVRQEAGKQCPVDGVEIGLAVTGAA